MLYVLRASLGDYDLSGYNYLDGGLHITAMLIWLLIVFSTTIVFMNLLIAVISDVYERVMSNRVEEVYQMKVNFIYEQEIMMGPNSS